LPAGIGLLTGDAVEPAAPDLGKKRAPRVSLGTIARNNRVWRVDILSFLCVQVFLCLAMSDGLPEHALLMRAHATDANFCVSAPKETLAKYGAPDIFNTNQSSQLPVLREKVYRTACETDRKVVRTKKGKRTV